MRPWIARPRLSWQASLAQAANLPPRRGAVLGLPHLTGDAAVLAEAEATCLNATMMTALAELQGVARLLEGYGVADAVSYDLAEVRDLDYYTGVTFEGFAPGLGFAVISGGRYDDLIGHFGPPLPRSAGRSRWIAALLLWSCRAANAGTCGRCPAGYRRLPGVPCPANAAPGGLRAVLDLDGWPGPRSGRRHRRAASRGPCATVTTARCGWRMRMVSAAWPRRTGKR